MIRTALVIHFCFSFHLQIAQSLKVVKTECEHKNNPLGIDTEVPRFSRQMQSSKSGVMQTATVVIEGEHSKATVGSGAYHFEYSFDIQE